MPLQPGAVGAIDRIDAMARFHHAAIHVDDLRAAEGYFAALFGAVVAFREALLDEGWATFPEGADWDDFADAQPGMAALRIGEFELALLVGEPVRPGSLDHIALVVAPNAMPAIAAAAAELGCSFEHRSDDYVMFTDRYGVGWELSPERGQGPTTPIGARHGRWVDV